MSEDDYITEILNIGDDYYFSIKMIEYEDPDLSYFSSDEINYLHYYISKDNIKLFKKYFDILKNYIKHEALLEEIDNFLQNSLDSFGNLMEQIKYYDKNFNNESREGYFTKFCESLEEKASDIVSEDAKIWEDSKIGEFTQYSYGGYNNKKTRQVYNVELNEIIESLNLNSDTTDFNVNEWIQSSPSDVSNIPFNFQDYAIASTYLGSADNTEANEYLSEKLNYAINIEIYEDEEDEDLYKKLAENVQALLNKGFESEVEGSGYSKSYIFVKRFKNKGEVVDVIYNPNRKDKYVKKERQDLLYIINKDDIEYDGECTMYILKKPLKYYNFWNMDYMFNERNIKDVIDKGIGVKRINILENYIHDPNQLEFKFEGIKSFKAFKQSKL